MVKKSVLATRDSAENSKRSVAVSGLPAASRSRAQSDNTLRRCIHGSAWHVAPSAGPPFLV
ncbi:hypothetical protein E2C01_097425 [Portunus trituberculatus]|uniref:Uncharacterized protein n=1 Tax=Portunus trituberculatus TaxID=210409 RepID=A0A5B7K5N1_PORTR|nr:hypothetical protein [Portunus trituberculatus]